MIDNILCDIIDKEVKSNDVACFLSGGVDSLSLAFSAHRLGKKVHGYTFHLEGNKSYDARKAEEAADKMGWKINTTVVPIDNLENDFIRLLRTYKCVRKPHFECAFPFLYVYPQIKQKYILSGLGADGHQGMGRLCNLFHKTPKEKFDKFRIERFKKENYAGIEQHLTLCEEYDKVLVHPYYKHKDVTKYFMKYDWFELNKPQQKTLVRQAFKEDFDKVGKVKLHSNLQIESKINKLFEQLIDNEKINFKKRKHIMHICKDWSMHGSLGEFME